MPAPDPLLPPDDGAQPISRAWVALSRVNQAIKRVGGDRDRLFADVIQIIQEELAYEVVLICEVGPEGEICPRAPVQDLSARMSNPLLAAPAQLRVAAQQASDRCQPTTLVMHERGDDGRSSVPWVVCAVPIAMERRTDWMLFVASNRSDAFAPAERSFLAELARDLGFALAAMDVEARTEQAERALRMSEERFRRLAEHSLVGIVMVQDDRYRYVNPAFAEMFGYRSPGDIIDRLGPVDLAAPESRELVAENLRRRAMGQVRAVRYQYRGQRQDGTTFDVEEYGARTAHAQRLGVVATVLDITAREASRRRLEALSRAGLALSTARTPQQALQRAVERLVTIFACDAASIVLLETSGPRLAAHVGSDRLPGSVWAGLDAAPLADDFPLLKHIIEGGETVVGRGPGPASDVAPSNVSAYAAVPLVVRDEIIGAVSVEVAYPGEFSEADAQPLRLFADHLAATLQHLRLISSLEQERNRLRILNELSHTLSETLQLNEVAARALRQIGQALHADFSCLYLWDQAAERFTAVAAEGLPELSREELNADLNASRPGLDAWVAVWRDGHHQGNVLRTPHWGPTQTVVAGVKSVLDVPLEIRGELIGVVTFLSRQDQGFDEADSELVTALSVPVALALQNARFYERAARQAELMGEALHRQEDLDRMKDELIQNISHELRTPLALVMGYAEMLDSGQLGALSDQQSSAVHVITRRSRMLRSLVEDIALLWHLERRTETREPMDLHEVAATAVEEFAAQAQGRGLTLVGELSDEPAVILAVPVQIRRVLDNLVGNSLKFTPAGGEIQIALHVEGSWAELSVADTGIGVPREKLHRIFERFYQVDGSPRRKYGGTGLGLALVKAIVEAHDGTISAESPITDDADYPGTRIAIRLPLLDESEGADALGENLL